MSKRKNSSAKSSKAGRISQARPAIPASVVPHTPASGTVVRPVSQSRPVGKTTNRFPIVGVGSSAGGLEALEELFRDMPANTGMAFVVVSHLHPGHTSMLPELLGKATRLPVVEASDGLRVKPDHVYVSPAGGHLAILNGILHRMETDSKQIHLPIDYFLRSLATDQKEKAVCIILSGTGTDGTLGLKAVKAELGMSMVQQVESAKYAGMPSSAIGTGLADFVLPPASMSKQLVAYAKGPYLATPAEKEEEEQAALEPIQKIFVLLRERVGHDFSGYKASTIWRRIDRRMNLHQLKNPQAYLRYLQDNPHELEILFKELLIGVTSFFRDPDAFESLKTALLELLKSRSDNYALRIWVPGCSSGEEVYSLAMVLRECIESLARRFDVQIFGTDLDSEAVDIARNGQYPDGIAVDVSPQRLDRFFVRNGSSYRIRKEIREMTVFAVQNVIKDAPFTKLDLVSCRNLLIYLNVDLQKRLLPIFHYSLKPGGLLFLGPSETIGNFTDLFEVIDKRWKIYRRKDAAPSMYPVLEFSAAPLRDQREVRHMAAPGLKEANIVSGVEKLLLGRFAPASVVINDRGDALFFHGRTGLYLEPAIGKPRLNVVDMAREGLQLELSAALRHAAGHNGDVVRNRVRVKTNGDFVETDLTVSRITEPESLRGLFLVTFRPTPAQVKPVKSAGRRRPGAESSQTAALERELQSTKESLQTTIEELETSNEELKSTNEELQSTNEELQSANEELETSKEEMQSLNEELSTVNAELQSKVDELSRSNDDMQNLLNSIEIATIFLDGQLKITRYTEQAKRLVNLIQTDVGRPFGDLVSNLAYTELVADCREVLRTLAFKQAEVQTKEGHWYLLRIMPYRTGENIIDGLVLTFVDIDPVKQAEKSLRRMSKVFTDGLDPVLIVDLKDNIIDLNDEMVRSYGWTRNDLLNQPVAITAPPAERKILEDQLERCRKGDLIRSVECRRVDKQGREYRMLLTLSLLRLEEGQPDAISMTFKQVPSRDIA
jgi:two-component system, chemotaxis family, CheB/CheR fusion protein